VERLTGRPAEEIQMMAQAWCALEDRAALLAGIDESSGKASLVFARSARMEPEVKMGEILAAVCAPRGGKGGGTAVMARGGIPAPAAAEVLEEAFALLAARLGAR
jgi:alanyl-tRNA synthetase